jgi:type IV secretion system protein VirD4
VFLSWFGGLVISRQKPNLFFGGMIQLPPGDQLLLVSSAARICTRETRCTENRQFSGPAIPPPAPTPGRAGTSDDRPDLPADDWTAPCTAEPVAAAAIGLVVGSFAGAGAAMGSDSTAPRQEPMN